MWLPLLAIFFWLAWAGWNEYQKLEAYKQWAVQFERAKYDIYAALGQKGDKLVWGLPTRQGIIETQALSIKDIQTITLEIDGQSVSPENSASNGKLTKGKTSISLPLLSDEAFMIPCTDGEMAKQWYAFLEKRADTP